MNTINDFTSLALFHPLTRLRKFRTLPHDVMTGSGSYGGIPPGYACSDAQESLLVRRLV